MGAELQAKSTANRHYTRSGRGGGGLSEAQPAPQYPRGATWQTATAQALKRSVHSGPHPDTWPDMFHLEQVM